MSALPETAGWDSADLEPDRVELAARAARMYYVQDMTMGSIAAALFMSRSTVSRLLTWARETGLVEIRIRNEIPERRRLIPIDGDAAYTRNPTAPMRRGQRAG